MRGRHNLILLAAVFTLLTTIVVINKRQPAMPSGALDGRLLSNRSIMEVRRMDFFNPKGHSILSGHEDNWRIVSPRLEVADAGKINSFLSILLTLQPIRQLAMNENDLADYGLGRKQRFIAISYAGGQSDTLFMGGQTPSGNSYLMKNADTSVYTVPNKIQQYVHWGFEDLQMKRIAALPWNSIISLRIAARGSVFECAKDSLTHNWRIRHPVDCRGDNDVISGYLSNLINIKADSVMQKRPSKGSGNAPHILLRAADGTEIGVLFKTRQGGVEAVVHADGVQRAYIMPKRFLDFLHPDWKRYRSKSIIQKDFYPEEIDEITLESDTIKTVLRKDSSGLWSITPSLSASRPENSAIINALYKFKQVIADSLLDIAPSLSDATAKEEPVINGIIIRIQGRTATQLKLRHLPAGQILASDGSAYFLFSEDKLEQVWKDPFYFTK